MPYCADCRTEYRDGFTVCADCGAPLVETPPPPPDSGEGFVYDGEPVLLCSAADGVEAGMLMAALEDQGIPALRKLRGATGLHVNLVFGASYQGADILVPPLLLDRAREVADAVLGAAEEAEDDASFEDYGRRVTRNRHIKGWIMVAIFFGLPALLMLLMLLMQLLNGSR